jgi:hypothetical protein
LRNGKEKRPTLAKRAPVSRSVVVAFLAHF